MKNSRFTWIDGIKGVACWIVLFHHMEIQFGYVPVIERIKGVSVFKFITNGTWALNLFFCFSAFLVASQIIDASLLSVPDVGRKIIKRYFRLSIPLFLVNLATFIFQKVGFLRNEELAGLKSGDISEWFDVDYSFFDVIKESFFSELFTKQNSFSHQFWMMRDLFLGYCFSILMALLISSVKSNIRLALSAVICLFCFLLVNQMAVFAFGTFSFCLYKESDKEKNGIRKLFCEVIGIINIFLGIVVAAYADSIVLYFREMNKLTGINVIYWWDWVGACLFLTGVILAKYSKAIFQNKYLEKAGIISFGIFLWQGLIECLVGANVQLFVYKHGGTYEEGIKAVAVSTIIALIAVCILYEKYVEKRINSLIEKILNKVRVHSSDG